MIIHRTGAGKEQEKIRRTNGENREAGGGSFTASLFTGEEQAGRRIKNSFGKRNRRNRKMRGIRASGRDRRGVRIYNYAKLCIRTFR